MVWKQMLRALFFSTRKCSHHLVQHIGVTKADGQVFVFLLTCRFSRRYFVAIFQQPATQKEDDCVYVLDYLVILVAGFLVRGLR